MRILFTLLLPGFVALSLHAQTGACSRELDHAEELFEQGRLLEILDNARFMECFSNFSKEEKARAHKLLTKTYIFTDNEPKAEKSLIDLLQVDKEHNLARTDPSELHFLYSKFRSEPIFRIGLRVGANKSVPIVLQEFNTSSMGGKRYNENGSTTEWGLGVTVEALIERHLKGGIEVAIGPQLRTARYEVEGVFTREVEGVGGSATGLAYLVKNQSRMLRAPLLGRYNFGYDRKNAANNRAKLIPYVFLGASFDYLLNAEYVETNRIGGDTYTLPESQSRLSDLDQVAKTNVSVLVGVGAKYRVANVHFLTFECRFDNALFNYINTDNRYANSLVFTNIGYVEDDLTLNTISVSFGYTYSIYNPTKRKQYR